MDTILTLLSSKLSSEPFMILVQIVLFYIFHMLMCQIFYKPLAKVRSERKAVTVDRVKKAESINEETLKLKREYEDAVSAAQKSALEKVQKAQKEAESIRSGYLEKAKAEAASILKQAKAEVAEERRQLDQKLDKMVSELALDAAKRIIASVSDGTERERLERKLAGENVL